MTVISVYNNQRLQMFLLFSKKNGLKYNEMKESDMRQIKEEVQIMIKCFHLGTIIYVFIYQSILFYGKKIIFSWEIGF